NTNFVAAKIDHTVMLLVSTAAMSHRQLAVVVAAVDPVLAIEQRLERLVRCKVLLLINDWLEAKRVGFLSESLDCHYRFSPYSIIFSPSRRVTYAFFQSDL